MKHHRPLVSIIIPTYNRVQLIGETLDSVILQTYQNWECLVIDDGSTDATMLLLNEYVEKDSRIQWYKRPKERSQGGNGARNYGLEKAKGEFIQWFDSDDLMKPQFLEFKMRVFEKDSSLDFVVSKSINFIETRNEEITHYQGNSKLPLTLVNFLNKSVYWMTPDVLFKRESVSSLFFDENLRSSQETNFFIRFLAQDKVKGDFINEVLTLRRIHPSSIQQNIKQNHKKATLGKLLAVLFAFFSIWGKITKPQQQVITHELMMHFYHLKFPKIPLKHFLKFTYYLIFVKGIFKALAFFMAVIMVSIFNRGYNLINYARS